MPLPPLVDPVADLSAAEWARTARHASLAGIGDVGQRRLAGAHVAVVGAGGLGSPVILSLAAAGVGTLTVIDDDTVDAANLQRQILHRHRDLGAPKVASAVRAAADLAPEARVIAVAERLTAANAARILGVADLVIDGSDSFATRQCVADACATLGTPLVWGVVQEFHAQVTVFWSRPPEGVEPVVLSDLHPPEVVGEPPSCAAVGVLGALCVQVGGMLSIEAVKLIVGVGEPLLGRVAVVDALRGAQHEVPLRRRTAVSVPAAPAPATSAAASEPIGELSAPDMLAAQAAGATLLDVREPAETRMGTVPGSLTIPLADVLADPAQVGAGPVVVICAHGIRARHAAQALRERGIRADVLAGGLAAWEPA